MGKLAAMKVTLSRTKQRRTARILLLFGAVTIVIGCARVQRASFADFWPSDGLSFKKAAGKVAGLVRPGKRGDSAEDEQVADKTVDVKNSDGTGEQKSWGARLVSFVSGNRDRSDADDLSESPASGLVYDPFLAAEQQTGPSNGIVAGGGGRPRRDVQPSSTNGTNPFADFERERKTAATQNQVRQPEARVAITDIDRVDPFRASETSASRPNAEAVSRNSSRGPAFADTFNAQMDRLREEMNEARPQTAAPDPDFERFFAGAPKAEPKTETPAEPRLESRDELPEFTKFAESSRRSPPAEDFELAPWDLEPATPAAEPAAKVARLDNAPVPRAESLDVPAESITAPVEIREGWATVIRPRRAVQRSDYDKYSPAGFASVTFPTAPRAATAPARAVPSAPPATAASRETEAPATALSDAPTPPDEGRILCQVGAAVRSTRDDPRRGEGYSCDSGTDQAAFADSPGGTARLAGNAHGDERPLGFGRQNHRPGRIAEGVREQRHGLSDAAYPLACGDSPQSTDRAAFHRDGLGRDGKCVERPTFSSRCGRCERDPLAGLEIGPRRDSAGGGHR